MYAYTYTQTQVQACTMYTLPHTCTRMHTNMYIQLHMQEVVSSSSPIQMCFPRRHRAMRLIRQMRDFTFVKEPEIFKQTDFYHLKMQKRSPNVLSGVHFQVLRFISMKLCILFVSRIFS